jgi:hypothetical protein
MRSEGTWHRLHEPDVVGNGIPAVAVPSAEIRYGNTAPSGMVDDAVV